MTEAELYKAFEDAPLRWGQAGRYPRGVVTIPVEEGAISLTAPVVVPIRCGMQGSNKHTYEVPAFTPLELQDDEFLIEFSRKKSHVFNGTFSSHLQDLGIPGRVHFGGAQVSSMKNCYIYYFRGPSPGVVIGEGSSRCEYSNNSIQGPGANTDTEYRGTGLDIRSSGAVTGLNNHYHRLARGVVVDGGKGISFFGDQHEKVATPITITNQARGIRYEFIADRTSDTPLDLYGAHSGVTVRGVIRRSPRVLYYVRQSWGTRVRKRLKCKGDPSSNAGATFELSI